MLKYCKILKIKMMNTNLKQKTNKNNKTTKQYLIQNTIQGKHICDNDECWFIFLIMKIKLMNKK